MRKFLILLALSVIGFCAYGQSTTISGKVTFADDPSPAVGAVVMVNAADSARLTERGRVVATDLDGAFTVRTNDKEVTLTITYLGYKDLVVNVPMENRTVDLGTLTMQTGAFMVEGVEVIGDANMSILKEDTLQFNAAAFKTNPDANAEDLLKKMPGITTDDDGNVESQGEKITKIYVNGKEYFEDDPSLALKSLPSTAVESIQLFDDQSEESKFSGFDDGERVKAINIVTKKGLLNSSVGQVSLGYGTDNRYMGGARLSHFGDVHSYTILAQANNANRRDFSPRDIMSGISGGRRGNWGNGADLDGFTTTTRGGITDSYMLGGNYTGDFDKVEVKATYFYMGEKVDKWSLTDQSYLTTPREFFAADTSLGFQNDHVLASKIEWNPNTNNRFNIDLDMRYSDNFGSSSSLSETFLDYSTTPTNYDVSDYGTNLERMYGNLGIWWQHKFTKPGRTLSLGGILSGSIDKGNRNQYSLYGSEITTGVMALDTIDLYALVDASSYSATGSVTYSEPLGEKSRVMGNYSINYNRSFSNNEGFDYDELRQQYALTDTSTTNYINRDYTTHIAGVGYNFVQAKVFNLTANLSYQHSSLNNTQTTPLFDNIAITDNYGFNALLPSLALTYTPVKGQNLKVNYSANSIFPSVTQLQSVLDATDPLQVSIGNPNLKQSYSHRLQVRYNLTDTEKNINFNLYASGTLTQDYIATHREFLTSDTTIAGVSVVKGAQFSTPVNLQGYANAMLYSTFSIGIKPLKSNLNLMAYYRFTNTPSIEDNIEYVSQSNNFGGNLSLTSNISENIDFTVAYRPGVNLTEGGTGQFDRYFFHNLSAFANIIFLKYFFVSGDASWRNSFGTQETYTQHYAMINAAIGAKFLKGRNAEVRLSVYDALNQNQSIWQTSADTYTQITESLTLGRYYMVSLTYKFDTRKDKSNGGNSGGYGGPGGGPGGHGGRF